MTATHRVSYWADSGIYGCLDDSGGSDGFGDPPTWVEIPEELWQRYKEAQATIREAEDVYFAVADAPVR
jgi:hypothetical protein